MPSIEALLFGSALNFVIGLALGLIPLFIARNKEANKYGLSALVLCAIAGLLVGLLGSVPIAAVLSGIALAASPERLKSLGNKEASGPKDIMIFLAFLLLTIGILVVYAIQVDAI